MDCLPAYERAREKTPSLAEFFFYQGGGVPSLWRKPEILLAGKGGFSGRNITKSGNLLQIYNDMEIDCQWVFFSLSHNAKISCHPMK